MSEVSSSHISPLGRLAAITIARRWGWRWQGWRRVGAGARCEGGLLCPIANSVLSRDGILHQEVATSEAPRVKSELALLPRCVRPPPSTGTSAP